MKNIENNTLSLNLTSVFTQTVYFNCFCVSPLVILATSLRSLGPCYVDIGVDYKKLFGGDYLEIFSIKQNSKRITVLPKNIRIFSNESISTLGTGLEYSAVYDSIKKCFSQNYGLEFVKNINDADLIMDIEVTTKENMRRESRKHPFKSEAFFILSFKYSKTSERMLSHIIANSEAVDYDFVERASIRSLKELSSKAIKSICQ